MRPVLLLPAPTLHTCVRCRITSRYVSNPDDIHDGIAPLYFVEHVGGSGDERYTWELCDLCEAGFQDEIENPPWEIFLSRGAPEWLSDSDAFYGFEDVPMLCVTNACGAGWRECKSQPAETWLFCRNREEWRSAWQIARVIAREGFWSVTRPPILFFLPAYKPADCETLSIATARLREHAPVEGPTLGQCDSCGEFDEVVKCRPGTQWAECQDCHYADVARVAGEEAGV